MAERVFKERVTRQLRSNSATSEGKSLRDNRKAQKKSAPANNTGLPDSLKAGIESLSGYAMDDVKVHYNSSQPAQLNAHAYAQGSSIHLAPGQEKHLPHEAWHVVQQKQGRVRATRQLKAGVPVNDDMTLEDEADSLGAKAANFSGDFSAQLKSWARSGAQASVIQRETSITYDTRPFEYAPGETEIVGKKMIATLDPDHSVVGSAPGGGVQKGLMGSLRTAGYKRMIRGHLLNGQLGGLGIAANLFPITAHANSLHKYQVENHVKDALSNGTRRAVRYEVEVTNADFDIDDPSATFSCNAKYTDDDTVIVDKDIGSDPKQTPARNPLVPEGSTSNDNSLNFRTADLTDNWGQARKGFNAITHAGTLVKTQFGFLGAEVETEGGVNELMLGTSINLEDGEADLKAYVSELASLYLQNDNNAEENGTFDFGGNNYTELQLETYLQNAISISTTIAELEDLAGMLN